MVRGPVYDNALRLLAAGDLVVVCQWLGIDADPGSIRVSEALPATTQHADLIVGLRSGRLAHVEFVRRPEPDLAYRMLEYRARILRLRPQTTLSQHIVVLAEGTVHNPFDGHDGLTMHLNVTYLRDQDPAQLLTRPALAALACLGAVPTPAARSAVLRSALTIIADVPDPTHRHDLTQTAATLAGIHLDPATIETITKEAAMPISLDEDTVAGRIIAATAEARGKALQRATTLAALIRRSFGDDPRIPALADHLATLPQEQALDAALTANTLDELIQTSSK